MLRFLVFFLVAFSAHSTEIPLAEKRSGYEHMSRETRAMQDDDMSNPGMLWIQEGEALWNSPAGDAQRTCTSCHGEARSGMKGVAARYPAVNTTSGHLIGLEQRINLCRKEQQRATPLAHESRELLALTALVSHQSRGMPIQIGMNETNRPFINAGRDLFQRRQGQLNIACSQCHDDNWGRQLGGNIIPQGHPNGYPLYRLEWQTLGSLQRRLRNCMTGLRAEPFDFGSPELLNLELFLKWRARGMHWESPAVRP